MVFLAGRQDAGRALPPLTGGLSFTGRRPRRRSRTSAVRLFRRCRLVSLCLRPDASLPPTLPFAPGRGYAADSVGDPSALLPPHPVRTGRTLLVCTADRRIFCSTRTCDCYASATEEAVIRGAVTPVPGGYYARSGRPPTRSARGLPRFPTPPTLASRRPVGREAQQTPASIPPGKGEPRPRPENAPFDNAHPTA